MSYATSWPILSGDAPRPFVPAPRVWRGNLCGVRVPGLPPVPGGADDPSLVLSWFYDRYNAGDRSRIRVAWTRRGYTHVALSWPDSASVGATPERFRDTVIELLDAGFFPCVFWCSKDFDEPDVPWILANIERPLSLLIGILPLACIGWELSLWLQPVQVQALVDAIAPRLTPSGCRVYVHFQQGYASFPPNTTPPQRPWTFGEYWSWQVGKLTGVLHQRLLTQDAHAYYYDSGGLVDILIRFAGGAGCPSDSGFGHPFDLVAWEITAQPQFNGEMTEATGDWWGTHAMDCPPQNGPAGLIGTMGSGNGSLA